MLDWGGCCQEKKILSEMTETASKQAIKEGTEKLVQKSINEVIQEAMEKIETLEAKVKALEEA